MFTKCDLFQQLQLPRVCAWGGCNHQTDHGGCGRGSNGTIVAFTGILMTAFNNCRRCRLRRIMNLKTHNHIIIHITLWLLRYAQGIVSK